MTGETPNFFPNPKSGDSKSNVALSPIVEGPPRFDVPPITAASFSRVLDFEGCPYRVLLKSVIKPDGDVELPPNHPLVVGRKRHLEAEYYILGTAPMTKGIKSCEKVLNLCKEAYEKGNATVEQDWAFDAAWEETGWYDEDVWLRVKCDATITYDNTSMTIYDWKSGKSEGYEVKQMQQAQLYVAAAFMRHPVLEVVEVRFAFFKNGKMWSPRQSFTRPKSLRYVQKWTQRIAAVTSATEFIPKPNLINCKYCKFGAGEFGSGVCAYAVEQ